MKILLTRNELIVMLQDKKFGVIVGLDKEGTELEQRTEELFRKATVPHPAQVYEERVEEAKKKEEPKKRKLIDHGKIVACYKGGRTPQWIADDMGISWQTVVNHLEKEGIYKKL